MNKILSILVIFILPVFYVACEREKPDPLSVNQQNHGIIVTNEGNLNSNNGTVSYINTTEDSVVQDYYFKANGNILGDVVQSFAVADTLGFIVVNSSGKVVVVSLNSFKKVGVISASYPRYFCSAGVGKGYLTNSGFPGEVLVVNTHTLAVTDTIIVGNQPEHLLKVGNYVYVANGKWGNDNTVSVIDVTTDKVVKTIEVGDGAVDLVKASDGNIWVICQGKVVYNNDYTQIIGETESRLSAIDPEKLEKSMDLVIGSMGDYFNPYLMAASSSGDTLYFAEASGIYTLLASTHEISAQPLITGNFYGLGVNPLNGDIFALDAKNYTSRGEIRIYNGQGGILKSLDAGIAPNGVVFY